MSVHLFLSPHLDDAILSCGGVMHRLVRGGERVIIVTAMAGEPREPLPSSPVVQTIRVRWNSGDSPFRTRRGEDILAAQQLGAQVYHMPLIEAPFRAALNATNDWIALYPEYDSPFLGIHDADEARLFLFETRLAFDEVTVLYAPFGIDAHVDHQLVRDWALVLTGANDSPILKFYEEYPHARNQPAIRRARTFYRKRLPDLKLAREIVMLDADDCDAKLRAMGCYGSHLHVLWNDPAEMERLAREYMVLVGDGTPAERFWRVVR